MGATVETLDYELLFNELISGSKLTADGGRSFVAFDPSYKNPFRHVHGQEKNVPMDELWSNTKWEHYIDTERTLVFKEWLEKQGVLESFLKQGKPDRTKDTSPGLWLGYSNSKIFSWVDSEEGFAYWEQINYKWHVALNHHSLVESGF